jgi:hypothetical protein
MEGSTQFADASEVVFVDRRAKVLLECNGAPHDIRSVKITRVRKVADEVELVIFTCPRCGKRHHSLRFV